MKFVAVVLLALAISSEALYPLPEPVIPATVYGVPEAKIVEAQPVVPVPIKTEYSYNIAPVSVPEIVSAPVAVPEIVPAAVAPIAPAAPAVTVHEESHPLLYPYTIPSFYNNPFLVNYAPQAPALPTPEIYNSASGYVLPHGAIHPLDYSSFYPYGYGYGYSGLTDAIQYPFYPFVQPTAPYPVVSNIAVSQPVVTESTAVEEVHAVVPQEPIVSTYEYQIPQTVVAEKVVIPEIPKPILPQTTYGLPL